MSRLPYDPDKDAKNVAKHKISLARAKDLLISRFIEDDRQDYGETRYRAWGYIDGKPHHLTFTMRDGEMRPISLHKIRLKDMKKYVKETED
jgi:uncharacterized protein